MAIPAEASESVNPRTSLWTKVICHCCHLITIPTYLEQGRPIISVTVTSSDRRGSRALCEGRAVGMLCNSQKTSWPNKHRRAQRVSQRWHFALSLPCRELHKQFLVTFSGLSVSPRSDRAHSSSPAHTAMAESHRAAHREPCYVSAGPAAFLYLGISAVTWKTSVCPRHPQLLQHSKLKRYTTGAKASAQNNVGWAPFSSQVTAHG